MSRGVRAILAGAAMAAMAFALWWHFRARGVENGIALCVAHASHRGEVSLDPQLLAAVVIALPEGERQKVNALLDDANMRWEARANPLLEDLGEGDPDEAFDAWRAHPPTSVATAYAASSSRFCGSDGFCVEPVMRSSACAPGFAPAAGKELERARFLAWPFAHAVWLRAPSEDDAKRIADALRLQARAHADSQIGLVLHPGDEARSHEPPFSELRERFVRHEGLERLAKDPSAAAAPRDASHSFPLRLDPRDVLVLPRLEALTHLEAYEAELQAYR